MLELPDAWTWDFWVADTATGYHLFFLFASRALHDETRRHRRASIGHAFSTDLSHWHRLPDALVRSDPPAFDDVATWTGSIVQGDDGLWNLFYTGVEDHPVAMTQRISVATSTDLMTWTKSKRVLAAADPHWYETAPISGGEHFRDPWVMRGADGRWHMLITAHGRDALRLDDGVIGYATSDDLVDWRVRAPLSTPGHGFGQLEVMSVVELDGEPLLLFSCLADELSPARLEQSSTGGIWFAPAGGVAGPFDLAAALPLTDSSRYAGRAVRDRTGTWQLLAFENDVKGTFVGRLADPVPLAPLITTARSLA